MSERYRLVLKDSNLKVKDITEGYALVKENDWKNYKLNSFIHSQSDNIDELEYRKNSLYRQEYIKYIIINCNPTIIHILTRKINIEEFKEFLSLKEITEEDIEDFKKYNNLEVTIDRQYVYLKGKESDLDEFLNEYNIPEEWCDIIQDEPEKEYRYEKVLIKT